MSASVLLRRHPVLSLLTATALSLGLLLLFYLYCFHYHVFPVYLFINASRWLEPALCFIIVLLVILVVLALGLMVLMRRHANRLESEIVERAAAEKARDEVKQALLQSQKLEAVGLLAGGIAHNFNNILYAIQGYVQLARGELDSQTVVYRNLGKVLEAVEHGQEVVQSILCFSRQEYYPFESVCLKEILDSTVKLLRVSLPAAIELQVTWALEQTPWLPGNRAHLQQVFINIIRNAADAMDQQGRIAICATLEDTSCAEFKALFPRLPHATYCRVIIEDHGAGISEEAARHLFEPFFTTKEVGKGTGLGLATAHSIVRDHQGEMVVRSVLGRGSQFTILLPVDLQEKEKE